MRRGNDGDFVYVLNAAERTVSLRPVQRGQATADRIQVASGLKAGEQVITEGADRLKDGAPVVLQGDTPAGPRGAASGGKRQRPGAPQPGASAPAGAEAASAGLPADGASSPQRRRRASQAEGA